jgi:CheY-like chemotaxis protein
VSGRRILVVEDNRANRMLVSIVLRAAGFEVAEAIDAWQAIAHLDREIPDLILMDLQLPGMDGLDLTRRLRADPRYGEVVIVAFTAFAMKGDEERGLLAGCDGYITKPIDTRTFAATVAGYLARGRVRPPAA